MQDVQCIRLSFAALNLTQHYVFHVAQDMLVLGTTRHMQSSGHGQEYILSISDLGLDPSVQRLQ